MERTTLDLWVGIFVVAGIAALVMLALKVGNLSTYNVSDTYQLHAYFSNIGGLKPQASVRSSRCAGRAGNRDHAWTPKRYEAKVTMSIDKRYQFPKDTFANILTSGLLGEQYIGLCPGGDDDVANGDEIKQTQSAIVLENLIGKFMYNKAEGPAAPNIVRRLKDKRERT